MEINEDIKVVEKGNKFNLQKIITYIGYFLFLLLIIYMFYLIEKYALYTPIYFFLKLLLVILNIYSEQNKIYILILSVIIVIILHILVIKIIIISLIFLSGGLFARFTFYGSFKTFINQQIEFTERSIESLYFSFDDNSKNDLFFSISKITSFHKAYNYLKNQNNPTFEIKQLQFGEYLNNIIFQYNKYKEGNFEQDKIKNDLINQLKLYQKNLKPYTNFSFIDILIKFNYYNSLKLFNELLLYSFEGRNCNNINISKDFNIYIISPEIKNPEIKTLIIFCTQNAFNIELFSFLQDNIKFYINIKEITIIIWNYKGFGLRKGFPSFNSIDKDVDILKEYINNNYKGYKIIIHGISIGGYPSIKLAKVFNDNKNVCLIVDRTYIDIDYIAESIIKNGKKIYNLLFPKFFYKSDNLQNYIDVPIGNKIILYDENDKIINYSESSLIYYLTLKYYKEIILPKISKYKQYTELIKFFSEDSKDLIIDVRRIKQNHSSTKLDEKTLIFINNLSQNMKSLDKFLMYFLIFGYPFNLFKEINYDKIIFAKNYISLPEIMKNIYENYKNKFSKKLINFIAEINFLFIKCNLIIPFSDEEIISFSYNNDNNDFILQEGFQENLMNYFGYVHRVFCGHNGTLDSNDEKYLKKYFELNGFISDSSNFKNINNKN